jgi:hypothetical protein
MSVSRGVGSRRGSFYTLQSSHIAVAALIQIEDLQWKLRHLVGVVEAVFAVLFSTIS